MIRLKLLLVALTIAIFAASSAWAGGSQISKKRDVSYNELSPAVFFGYTTPETPGAYTAAQVPAAEEKSAQITGNKGVSYSELSPAVFFGYAPINPPKAEKNREKIEMAQSGCGMREIKTTGSPYQGLSPAEFFGYGG